MKCPRCNGFMHQEKFFNRSFNEAFLGWRCVHCGELVDEVVLKNRALSRGFQRKPYKRRKNRTTYCLQVD